MNFVIDYEICSILFLIVTIFSYFSKRFLPTMQNKYYGWLLISGLFFLCLDVASCVFDRYSYAFRPWFLYLINAMLLILTQIYIAFVYAYSVVSIRRESLFANKLRILLAIPLLISIVMLLATPWTGWIFYLDGSNKYWHGPLHSMLYVVSTVYLVCTAAALLLSRKTVERRVRLTMASFLILSVVATLIQFFFPRYMLNGVAVALSLNIMLNVLQSPDLYLDKMTGLYNRNAMPLLLECETQRKKEFSVVVYLVDGLNTLVSLYGVYAGEEILVLIADELRKAYPKHEIFRNGYDSIGVFVQNASISDESIDRYAAKFPAKIKYQERELSLLCRTLALSGADFASTEAMIFAIDEGMETLRNDGFAGSIFVCDQETDANYRYRHKIETELSERIADRDIDVSYCPINSIDGRLYAAKAQMTIVDENGEKLPMQVLYSLAMRRGLVIPLNTLLLERVCVFLKRYDIRRWGAEHVFVPLSSQACMQQQLTASILRILARYQIDPRLICFTVTEKDAISAADNLEPNMRQLTKSGCCFLLDEYGTGYANLDLLARLPFSYLNMEQGFVKTAWRQKGGKAYIANLIQLFENMGMAVSCTVPDSEGQTDELRDMGFRYIHVSTGSSGMTEDEFRDCLADSASALWNR